MPVNFNSNNIGNIVFGSNQIGEVRKGETLVWSSDQSGGGGGEPPTDGTNTFTSCNAQGGFYQYFVSNTNGSGTVHTELDDAGVAVIQLSFNADITPPTLSVQFKNQFFANIDPPGTWKLQLVNLVTDPGNMGPIQVEGSTAFLASQYQLLGNPVTKIQGASANGVGRDLKVYQI